MSEQTSSFSGIFKKSIKASDQAKSDDTVNQETPLKKGRSSWQPASLNDFIGKEDGYRYRMSHKDPVNLAKKQQEGWETVSGIQSANTAHIASGRMSDGSPISSVQEGHDWVLQRLPEEVAQERDEFFNQKSSRQIQGLTAHVKKEIRNSGANTHGDITISSRRGTQVIE